MNKYEEIFFISNLLSKAQADKSVELSKVNNWKSLYLNDETKVQEDYLFRLNQLGILHYEEIGEDGFKPIVICSIKPETTDYLKKLLIEIEQNTFVDQKKIEALNKRITEILTFDPQKLSNEIKATENIISNTKEQLKASPLLQPLMIQLNQIELHFRSLSQVANNYEEVYKNIILPVREEGKSGVRQTVKWAVISIIVSTFLSLAISWLTK
ncbi:hypothetical protein [Pedobacter mendelii]|uniref:Uncharacterized protein n=1 Tax=Pedobacter mendelii TaxID=1908240 RepID=A0ABQ2BLY6_9SPHI|nr:hypothetical protein [Pedobacter mendelii]GGI29374.1 hypothetical protein GCM10008119_37310 [Pedobacter mendelii]